MPKVSIVVPVYNTKDYIARCLDSLVNQTIRDIEIICVDDGSTDGSAKILDEYVKKDKRIKVIHKENGGVALARKIGVEVATGEYIAFVDSDDYVELNMYEILMKKMNSSDIIMSNFFFHYGENIKRKCINNFDKNYYSLENIDAFYKTMLYSFENDAVTEIGSLCNNLYITKKMKLAVENINLSIKHWEDMYLLVIYLLDCTSVTITDECFYHCVYRSGSASNSKNIGILFEYSQLYIELSNIIENHKYVDLIKKQFDKWFVNIVNASFSQYFQFEKNILPTRYVGDFKNLDDKKIVLYCAGDCGQDIYKQLKYFDYNVVLWVDKNYNIYQEKGFIVNSPTVMSEYEFDCVYIAIENSVIAEQIKCDLYKMGIEKNRIIYVSPKKLW